MRPFGFTARYSGVFDSSMKLTETCSYSTPTSSIAHIERIAREPEIPYSFGFAMLAFLSVTFYRGVSFYPLNVCPVVRPYADLRQRPDNLVYRYVSKGDTS